MSRVLLRVVMCVVVSVTLLFGVGSALAYPVGEYGPTGETTRSDTSSDGSRQSYDSEVSADIVLVGRDDDVVPTGDTGDSSVDEPDSSGLSELDDDGSFIAGMREPLAKTFDTVSRIVPFVVLLAGEVFVFCALLSRIDDDEEVADAV